MSSSTFRSSAKAGMAASTSGRLANWFEAETQPYFAGQHGWKRATVPGEDPLQAVVLAFSPCSSFFDKVSTLHAG